MLLLIRPGGGETYVHESRLDEYLGRGFHLPDAPRPPQPAKKPAAKKQTKAK
ncbi:MAG: hypothetical protein IKD61_09585 [Oscillospiraceae bacterium]|nr:hypothetical protein [Oscillospiraceae bacterium]